MQDPIKLSPEDYWEWRTTITEMEHAKTKRDNDILKHQLLLKDAEILKHKALLQERVTVQFATKLVAETKKEYDLVKKRIEEKLGISLNGKLIDDTTYEVRDVPQVEETKGE